MAKVTQENRRARGQIMGANWELPGHGTEARRVSAQCGVRLREFLTASYRLCADAAMDKTLSRLATESGMALHEYLQACLDHCAESNIRFEQSRRAVKDR